MERTSEIRIDTAYLSYATNIDLKHTGVQSAVPWTDDNDLIQVTEATAVSSSWAAAGVNSSRPPTRGSATGDDGGTRPPFFERAGDNPPPFSGK